MTDASAAADRPLDGLRVLELGQLMAGPFAGTILGTFGAEVIKVEPPGGDPIRTWRVLDQGTSLWWRSLGRNKKCLSIDLKQEAGRALVRRLAARSDVLIENFRPGTLEAWGLDPADLERENPGLIVARVSGYGQTGPNAHRPGFASVCEAYGGLRYVTGHSGELPVRANLSIGDSIAGLHAALGILLALQERAKPGGEGRGQTIDLAIFEAVYNLMEAVVPEYDRAGVVREPSGIALTGVVPTNIYRCRDGRIVVIGGSGNSIFQRLMHAIGRPDLATDPGLGSNEGRMARETEIDAALAAWAVTLPSTEVLAILEAAAVPSGPIHSVADMFADPHYRARGLFEQVEVGGRPLALPAIAPKLSKTPGRTDWPGPEIGAHTEEVLSEVLGLNRKEIAALRAAGVV